MMPETLKQFQILSLDGGGIRGAYIAGFLADLEERLGVRLCEYFDLIAGTSTGGIIAAALALGEPAQRIEAFYRKRGAKIFGPRSVSRARWWCTLPFRPCTWLTDRILSQWGLSWNHLVRSKYEPSELKSALVEVFGQKTVADARTRLIIPSVDLTNGKTVVFKTPHLPDLTRDSEFSLVDIILSTTAAPTYFPHATMQPGSAYVDGGLWANNPSMVSLAEAMSIGHIRNEKRRPGIDLPIDQNSISMLSVGTGTSPFFATPPVAGAGVFWWALKWTPFFGPRG